MVNAKYFLEKMQDVKTKDYLAIFPMLLALVLYPLYKKRYKTWWLICEEKKEARDNGYWFFKHMCENHSDKNCVYAIDKKSIDYIKVRDLGNVVQFGSLKHWIIYFTCQYNISSQKGGKPNAALCSFIELNNFYNAHNVFLQHGVIINKLKWLYADCSRFDMMVASAKPEFDFIEKYFGYRKGVVRLTGLPRFDNLHNAKTKKNQIVIMPTWRYWFNLKSKQKEEYDKEFANSEYLNKWKELLENEKLNELILKNNLEIYFYPHRNMQNYLSEFQLNLKSRVIIASWEKYDIQDLLMTSAMMITDYSSVFFDMVYMKKPVLFYQFDLQKFRKGQYEQGYFDYQNNPFGKSYFELENLLDELEKLIKNEFQCDEIFIQRHKEYFPFYDTNNSERVYQEIQNIQN